MGGWAGGRAPSAGIAWGIYFVCVEVRVRADAHGDNGGCIQRARSSELTPVE